MSHDTMTLMERFNKEFSLSEQSLNGLTETPFHHLRRQAMDIFTQKGLPTIRHEEWKYTKFRLLHVSLPRDRGLSAGLQLPAFAPDGVDSRTRR